MPPYSVVVPGSLPGKPLPDGSPGPSLYCAVIVKTVDAQTRAKTGINELLEGVRARTKSTVGKLQSPLSRPMSSVELPLRNRSGSDITAKR